MFCAKLHLFFFLITYWGFFFCPLHSYHRAPLKCISHNLDQRLVCVHRSAFMLDVIRSRASLRQVPIRASAVSFLLCDEALKISAVYFRGRAEEAYCTQGHHLFYITCEKIIVQFCVCVCVYSSSYTVVGIDFFRSKIAAKPTLVLMLLTD